MYYIHYRRKLCPIITIRQESKMLTNAHRLGSPNGPEGQSRKLPEREATIENKPTQGETKNQE
eukprot:2407811-Prorocentrum_lima.AAC.1